METALPQIKLPYHKSGPPRCKWRFTSDSISICGRAVSICGRGVSISDRAVSICSRAVSISGRAVSISGRMVLIFGRVVLICSRSEIEGSVENFAAGGYLDALHLKVVIKKI